MEGEREDVSGREEVGKREERGSDDSEEAARGVGDAGRVKKGPKKDASVWRRHVEGAKEDESRTCSSNAKPKRNENARPSPFAVSLLFLSSPLLFQPVLTLATFF